MARPASGDSAGTDTERVKDRFWAGSVRVVLAIATAVILPVLFPASAELYLTVSVAYLLGALFFQTAIARNVGGVYRQLLGGAMDLAMVTFIAHRMGAMSTPFVAAYPLVGMFYALVAPAWAATALAVLGVALYAGICYGAALGALRYAPDFREFAVVVPSVGTATPHVVLLAAFVGAATLVSRRIAVTLHSREDALRRHEHELEERNAQLRDLSQRDPLTQLHNRRHFMRRVEEELARVQRGHPMVLVMMDLDGFKKVNDTAGHHAGDDVLRATAAALRDSTRAVDVVARFGGDEFVVLLTDTDSERAEGVADRLLAAVREKGRGLGGAHRVTASIGLSPARESDDVQSLIDRADEAAYRAKREGGDRARFSEGRGAPTAPTDEPGKGSERPASDFSPGGVERRR